MGIRANWCQAPGIFSLIILYAFIQWRYGDCLMVPHVPVVSVRWRDGQKVWNPHVSLQWTPTSTACVTRGASEEQCRKRKKKPCFFLPPFPLLRVFSAGPLPPALSQVFQVAACAFFPIDVRDQSRRQHCKEVQRHSADAELSPAAPSSRPQQQQDEKPLLPILQGKNVPVSMGAARTGAWEGLGRASSATPCPSLEA